VTVWLTDEQQSAWRALLHMTSRLQSRLNRELQSSASLSLAEYDVLVLLSEAPDTRLRVRDMADELQWEQSRVSHQVSRMTAKGLVEREECETDRRGSYVGLTEAGRSAIEHAAPEHARLVRRLVFTGLTDRQVTALRNTANAVLAELGAVDTAE
jgi:DNA-binding MarR family transcriptional regulator